MAFTKKLLFILFLMNIIFFSILINIKDHYKIKQIQVQELNERLCTHSIIQDLNHHQ